MSSLAQPNSLESALAEVDELIQQIGVLAITTSARYTNLQRALGGFGNLDDARYSFALEASLLEDAHKQWKLAADALERVIALDVVVHPETGEHSVAPYVNADGSTVHTDCACDGSKPFGNGRTPFDSLPFTEPEEAILSERPWRPE